MRKLGADEVYDAIRTPTVFTRPETEAPRFAVGDHVVVRNINHTGHTRLPRYVRGHVGVVERRHGFFVYPDTVAHGLGDHPQHLYNVRFSARELFGEQGSERDRVYIDLWDGYIDRAEVSV